MKKLSIILVLTLVLTVIAGCAKRTAKDLRPTDISATESDTLESVDKVETGKGTKDAKKPDKTKESTETKKTESTKEEDKTDKSKETKGKEETPESSINTPTPSGNGSSSGGSSSGGSSNGGSSSGGSSSGGSSSGGSSSGGSSSGGSSSGGSSSGGSSSGGSSSGGSSSGGSSSGGSSSGGSSSGGSSSGGSSSGGSSSGGSSSGGSTAQSDQPKPQTDPNLPSAVEIYPMNGGNVAVVNVKNKTGHDCSVEVQGTYKKADGSTIRTETKRFSGLSAGDDNYFIFNPGIPFSDFTCVTKEISDGATAYSNQFSFASSGTAHIVANEMGNIDNMPEEYLNLFNKPKVKIELTAPGNLQVKAEILFFDNSGKPVYLDNYDGRLASGSLDREIPVQCEKSGGKYIMPDNLTGNLRFVISLLNISGM